MFLSIFKFKPVGILFVLLALAASIPLFAQDVTARLEAAVSLHDRARDGDVAAGVQAAETLAELLDEDADNARALVYSGSVSTLRARDSTSVVNKIRYSNRGLRAIDRALEVGADDFVVRLVRANVNLAMPKFFGRADDALVDMKALHDLYQDSPSAERAANMVDIYVNLRAIEPDNPLWEKMHKKMLVEMSMEPPAS